jgi:chromosomal replication initiation ATPase DnaA
MHNNSWETLLSRVANYYTVDVEDLKTRSKAPDIVKARSVFCYLAVRKLDRSCTFIARKLDVTPSSVSKAVIRGQAMVRETEIEKNLLEF